MIDRKITTEEISLFNEILEIKHKKKTTKQLTQLRCGIYARKSQEDERDTSLQTQIDYCKELIESCNMLMLKEVYSEDNQSGMTDDRPEFQRLIKDVISNEIDIVVCYRLDRFSRKLSNTQTYEEILRVNNSYLLAGDIQEIPDTAAKMFIRQIFQANGEFQARTSAERTKITLLNVVETTGRYVAGNPPLGYTKDSKGKLEIDIDESFTIDKIFTSFLGGKSLTSIACELNSSGVVTKQGNPFSKQAIYGILTNEVYTGTLVYNKKNSKKHKNTMLLKQYDEVRVKDCHPAIISKDEFDKVQNRLSLNATVKSNDSGYLYLLSGLVKCKKCGRTMIGKSQIAR